MAKSAFYRRIRGYLGDKYTEADDELIELYCEQRKMYKKMLAQIRKTGLLLEYTNKAGQTNTIKNPLMIEATKTAQVLNQLLKSLGLTAAQRKKVGGGDGNGGDGEDEFEKF